MSRPSLSRRTVAWLCALLLVVSILPMYALALYNHAFYDDFGFSLLTHDAWQSTGSLFAVLEAAVRNTVGIRQTWEGTYSTSLISTLQPAIFGEGAYWVTTFVLLTVFLLAVWFFLSQTLRGVYGMDRATVVAAFGILGFVLVQFVPDAAEAFYWFNGGVAYTLLWSVLLLAVGVWLKLERAAGRVRVTLLYLLALTLTALVGGGKYSTVLFAALLALCFTGWAFFHRRPKRWAYLSLTLTLLGCFAFSMTAPGNGVRAETLTGGMSAPKAVLEAMYFGLALMGNSFSLPLLAAMVLLVPLCVPALRQSGFRFGHPVWITLLAVALFCAQLAPTLYTGNYLGDGRALNTYHYAFVLTLSQLVLYWTGFILRRREHSLAAQTPQGEPVPAWTDAAAPEAISGEPAAALDGVSPNDTPVFCGTEEASASASLTPSLTGAPVEASAKPDASMLSAYDAEPSLFRSVPEPTLVSRLKAATLLVVAGMLVIGCMAWHPNGAASYGPQNMAGGSALRAVLSGQASAYRTAMIARDAELTDPALADVTLTPITDAPADFMGDALTSDNLEYVLRLYADYYDKASVQIAPEVE